MKIRTQEEQQCDDAERDAKPYIPGFTWGEFHRLTERQQEQECQKILQVSASSLGYWKTCSLSPCRRAKACRSLLSEAQATSGRYHRCFPPCIREGPHRQSATLREMFRLAGLPDDTEYI
ncbi:hypothetical protein [Pararhizobium sp.]|uniref:hypothetical protein n=1 Tax=Pararhizobium sp. TaxID=1977563 RepID=UPI003D0F3D12